MKPRAIAVAAIALTGGLLLINAYIRGVHADDRHERVCSEKTLRGSYGFYRTGTNSMGLPLVSVGFILFDGTGNFTATQNTSRNGMFTLDSTFSGTYEVAEDCTGKSFDNDVEFVRLVIVDGGKEIYQLSVTPGHTIFSGKENRADQIGDSG